MIAPLACPRCGAEVRGDQSWCLECGLAARTRVAPTPNWRLPLIGAAVVALAAIAALIVAFVVLTGDNAPVPAASTTPAPAVPTTPTLPASVATAPPPVTVTVATPTATAPPIPTTTTP